MSDDNPEVSVNTTKDNLSRRRQMRFYLIVVLLVIVVGVLIFVFYNPVPPREAQHLPPTLDQRLVADAVLNAGEICLKQNNTEDRAELSSNLTAKLVKLNIDGSITRKSLESIVDSALSADKIPGELDNVRACMVGEVAKLLKIYGLIGDEEARIESFHRVVDLRNLTCKGGKKTGIVILRDTIKFDKVPKDKLYHVIASTHYRPDLGESPVAALDLIVPNDAERAPARASGCNSARCAKEYTFRIENNISEIEWRWHNLFLNADKDSIIQIATPLMKRNIYISYLFPDTKSRDLNSVKYEPERVTCDYTATEDRCKGVNVAGPFSVIADWSIWRDCGATTPMQLPRVAPLRQKLSS